MKEEEYKEFKKDIEFKGLMINRIPDKARAIFKDIAKEEFADDYGLFLRELVYSYLEFQKLKSMLYNNELDIQIILGKKEQIPDEYLDRDKVRTNIAGEKLGEKGVDDDGKD